MHTPLLMSCPASSGVQTSMFLKFLMFVQVHRYQVQPFCADSFQVSSLFKCLLHLHVLFTCVLLVHVLFFFQACTRCTFFQLYINGTEWFVYTHPPVFLDRARYVQLQDEVTITMPNLRCEQCTMLCRTAGVNSEQCYAQTPGVKSEQCYAEPLRPLI